MEIGFIFQIAAVFLGGSSVQLLIFLVRRRAEIRELDSKADSVSLEASNNLITRLQLDGEQTRTQITYMRTEHLREMEEMTRRLTVCTEEGLRLTREVALLRNEIGIAQRQLEQWGAPGSSLGSGLHRRAEY